MSLDYPILSDPDKQFAKQLGVLMPVGFPNRWTYYIGVDGKILYIDKGVTPQTAGEAIAKKLTELGVAPRQP